MENLKLYEDFQQEIPMETREKIHFETETQDFTVTNDDEYGDYKVTFKNSENKETTIKVSVNNIFPNKDEAMSNLKVVENSSTDGKIYTAIGYFEESKELEGAYALKKVLVEQV